MGQTSKEGSLTGLSQLCGVNLNKELSAGTLKLWPQPRVGRDLDKLRDLMGARADVLGVWFFGGSKCSFDFSTSLKKKKMPFIPYVSQ